MNSITSVPRHEQVIIAGGGPVGLALSALLAGYGVRSLVIEADQSYCTGSRAICVSRRSQEILGWAGAAQAVQAKGLPWAGGRSYWRDQEVLHFQMPHEPTQRFAPMVNIQQFYVEQYAHHAAQKCGRLSEVLWGTKLIKVDNLEDGPLVTIEDSKGQQQLLKADYLIACDGGRSTVRDQLGLQLEGVQYEGKYVIVDVEQDTQRPVERLAWFDPPSNPGSTILMHRQPDNVWRIDYQVRDDEDPIEAVKPENVLPRVKSHLEMIGEKAPWKPLWISIYNAKCLTLPRYRYGRTLFAGDAGHLVPIFGVRGLNSGLDDAGNLAWKLALVLQGEADESLLESYSLERVHATRENIRYGAKSTEFMAPPSYGFALMREAALRLASVDSAAKTLINPRQSTAIEYLASPLNSTDARSAAAWATESRSATSSPQARAQSEPILRPGMPVPEAVLTSEQGEKYLTEYFGRCFVLLVFAGGAPRAMQTKVAAGAGLNALRMLVIAPQAAAYEPTAADVLVDRAGQAYQRFGATEGQAFLVRPDGYLMAVWDTADLGLVNQTLLPFKRAIHKNQKGLEHHD
jgi:3-(3-hydroxy-phenyl)propionate hydroxylase